MGCASSKVLELNIKIQKAGQISQRNSTKPIIKTKSDLRILTSNCIMESKVPISTNYKIIQKIGSGSFGQVYKVKQLQTSQIRALKKIKLSNTSSAEHLKEIIKEIEIVSKLEHPNIIKLYEYSKDEKFIYIISELLTGGELYDQISKLQFYSERKAAIIIEQLLSAVNYIHSVGVVHRDLKPENIMLETEKSGDLSIKIIDFGVSEFYIGEPLTTKVGTSYYIAPEVIRKKYTNKCDIWSIGVILFILLSGKPPFDGSNDEEIMESVLKGKFDFEKFQWEKISKEAKDLITKLLSHNYHNRLSAEEALQEPWILSNKKKVDISNLKLDSQLQNIKSFGKQHKFQQATIAFIIHQMSSTDLEKRLRVIFKSIDENGDGHLSYNELKKAYKQVFNNNQDFTDNEFDLWINSVDADKNGFIEYEEFLRATIDSELLFTQQNLKACFDFFDKDSSGYLSIDEVKSVLGIEGSTEKEKEIINSLVGQLDENGDNMISFEEFRNMITKISNI